MKRGLCVKNWINIRPKSGVILVWDLPEVDADTQWATIDILRWRKKVSLASTVHHYNWGRYELTPPHHLPPADTVAYKAAELDVM